MKINMFQILNIINLAMMGVEALKGKKTKQERIEAAVDLAAPFVQALELTFGKNLLKEQMIKPLVEDYITAAKTLVNGIQKFKDLKEASPKTESTTKVLRSNSVDNPHLD